jgi:hypothetical protein
MPRNQHSGQNINHLDQELQKALPAFLYQEQYRFNIIFEKDPWNLAFADLITLFSDGVLIRK